MNPVELERVSKSFRLEASPAKRVLSLFAGTRARGERFAALENLTFAIHRGETFCVIGRNGAGKSTLLRLIAGISDPTTGELRRSGRVAALLELGAGFHLDFTGRQNVQLVAALAGYSGRETAALAPRIEAFADIGEFIDRPVRTYSSGMVVRLAFAIAIHVQPDILLVDEALSVGDQAFRQRCLRKVQELRARGVSIVLVSHSTGEVKAMADRVLWLEHGVQQDLGAPDGVVAAYIAAATGQVRGTAPEGSLATPPIHYDKRHGDGRARITAFAVRDTFSTPASCLIPGESYSVEVSVEALQQIARPAIGFLVRNHLGIAYCGASTAQSPSRVAPMVPGERRRARFQFTVPHFYPGFFSFSPAVADGPALAQDPCDWIDNAVTLQMERGAGEVYGGVHIPSRIRWSGPPAVEAPRA